MTQYILENNELTLAVKKSPLFVRSIMFLFTFLFFVLPILGMVLALSLGKGFHIMYVMAIGLFGLIGFYMLRISLWNTYGSENILFKDNEVTYEADYGWFKDGRKIEEINPMVFTIKRIGYDEDNKGVLNIGDGVSNIDCVTKMPINEIEELIQKLKSSQQRI